MVLVVRQLVADNGVNRRNGFCGVGGPLLDLHADGADGGVDLILERPGERVLVQCKHWKAWKVGVQTIRELFGVMTLKGASGGIVATTGRFPVEC